MCLVDNMMVYLRTKKIKGNTYYYAVEGKRDSRGKVKQKVIKHLGTTENILKVFTFLEQHH